MKSLRKKIAAFVLIFCVMLAGHMVLYNNARAQSAMPPFGGMIVGLRWCNCPIHGFLVWVSPPVGGPFLYAPGFSTLYANGNILKLGSWVLGLHTGVPVTCGRLDEGFCESQIPTRGMIYMVGTS